MRARSSRCASTACRTSLFSTRLIRGAIDGAAYGEAVRVLLGAITAEPRLTPLLPLVVLGCTQVAGTAGTRCEEVAGGVAIGLLLISIPMIVDRREERRPEEREQDRVNANGERRAQPSEERREEHRTP